MTMTTFLLRVGAALLLGGLIGFERDIHGRAAGLRTNMLVSAGAALFTLISIMLSESLGGRPGDPGRIAAQIVSGIGFLGAGTILKSGFSVRGLTTAACMWLVAAVGMCCAVGMIWEASIVTVGVLLVLLFAKHLENKLHRLFSLKVTVISREGGISQRMQQFLKGRSDISIMSTDAAFDAVQGIHTVIFYLDTMTERGQLEMTKDIYLGIKDFEKQLVSMNIDCVA